METSYNNTATTNNSQHQPNNGNKKKSWSELKTVVHDLRRQLTNLSNVMPMNINFRTLSDGRVRIYFLSKPPNGWETTLLYIDVPSTTTNNNIGNDNNLNSQQSSATLQQR